MIIGSSYQSLAFRLTVFTRRYSHTLVPVLPHSLLEVLSSPTPFIIGVHSINQDHIADLLDVIVVDLDGGMIHIPENMTLQRIMEPLRSQVVMELSMCLHPELSQADNAFPSTRTGVKSPDMLDKELRAVMLRLMTQLLQVHMRRGKYFPVSQIFSHTTTIGHCLLLWLMFTTLQQFVINILLISSTFQGYRSCLTLVRIHPEPFISFHKAAFLGLRSSNVSVQDSGNFLPRFLECMFFNEFIATRGPPWRKCDIFDELYSELGEQLGEEQSDPSRTQIHIESLAKQLYDSENQSVPQHYSQRIPLPTEGHMTRVHQPVFPTLDPGMVSRIMEENQMSDSSHQSLPSSSHLNKLVPLAQRLPGDAHISPLTNNVRRLEVLRNCIGNIFENKISDAKKTLPAVIRALKSKSARLALCDELGVHVVGNQTMLEHQQFDMIVRLMNAALQDDSDIDMHGVAASLLPLACTFGRKLCPGVIQFVYTLIQDHAVWQNLQFWEAAFYNDVQKGIKDLYLAIQDQNSFNSHHGVLSAQLSVEKHVGARARELRRSALINPDDPSVLEIAASEIKKLRSLDESVVKEKSVNEEQTVYAQAIHYTTRMVCVLIPMDFKPEKNGKSLTDHHSDMISNSISNSVADTDSIDAESGFDDSDTPNDNGLSVIKFVSRFVDKVCGESSISDNHLKALHQMVPGVVAMHLESVEAVAREAKRLPPIQKPKFLSPSLLAGESLVCDPLRVYLMSDGREEYCGGIAGNDITLIM